METRRLKSFTLEEMQMHQRLNDVPSVLVDGAQGFAIFNGVVRVNLFQLIQDLDDPENTPAKVVVSRLSMSPETALAIADWLKRNVEQAAAEVDEGEADAETPDE